MNARITKPDSNWVGKPVATPRRPSAPAPRSKAVYLLAALPWGLLWLTAFAATITALHIVW